MEGEAKEAFASLPGFAAKGLLNPYVLILSDNNTKLSGRITHDAFDMQPTFETLEALGWKVIRVQNGHNLQAVYQAVEQGIEDAKNNPKKPVCLWVKTVKGYGVQATAESSSGGHGFPLANGEKIVEFVNEIYSGKSVPKEFANWADELYQDWKIKSEAKKAQPAAAPSVKKDKVQAGFSKAAIKAAQEGLPVVSISADLQGSTGMAGFHKNCPNRSVDVGVAESNMISIAAGYSKAGFIPIVDTFAQFGVTKGNLPLTMAALSQAPVIAAFSHIGFQDAADGASHQATTYLAAVCSIPHTVIVMPSCADEAEALMYQAIKRFAEARLHGEDGESVIFFVGRENFPVYYVKEAVYEWGKAQLLTEGDDVVIVAAGTLLDKALEAEKQLREKGTKATVIHHPFVNQPDVDNLSKALDRCKGRLVTVEDHQVVGGMGALLVHALSSHVKSWKSLGINNSFGQSAYLANHLYKMHGLDAAGIVKAVGELI
jgi:transketolase